MLPELQGPLLALDVDLLLRKRERDPAAHGVPLDPELADLPEQLEHLAGRALVDRLLCLTYVSFAVDRTRARSTKTSVPSPVWSTWIVHSSAGRTWSGSSEPASSEITFGWSGIFESAP